MYSIYFCIYAVTCIMTTNPTRFKDLWRKAFHGYKITRYVYLSSNDDVRSVCSPIQVSTR